MEVETAHAIPCPDHPDQLLSRVDSDPSAQKHLYCSKCIKQREKSQSLLGNLSNFLESASSTLFQYKLSIRPVSQVPEEYLNAVKKQAESLENFSHHITQEKEKIEAFFEDLITTTIDTLCSFKKSYLEILDKQVVNLCDNYASFGEMLKKLYPKQEDIENMFPKNEDLCNKLAKINNAADLDEFVKSVKEDLRMGHALINNQSDEAKQKFFYEFGKKLKEIETNKPTFEGKDLTLQTMKGEIKRQIDQFLQLGQTFKLQNPVSKLITNPDLLQYPESTIIQPQDFVILREWLSNYPAFCPKLIFRMTRDGRNSQAFHSHCDGKGPKITLIKCKYENASETSIIGGFLDQDYSCEDIGWVRSENAFVFSLSYKIKCPILRPEYALWNGNGFDIWFGENGAIGIKYDCLSYASYIAINQTYKDCHKIIPPESYKGPNKYHQFMIDEIEVYTI